MVPQTVGRYTLYEEISSGGMGSVHFGRFVGPARFGRTVAIKKLHRHLASESDFVAMLADEARLASRVRHPNVVQTIDVVESAEGLFVVMDYVHGESLSRLIRATKAQNRNLPPQVVVAIMVDVLRGLHAAHEATGESGDPLGIIHRDVSPQNILVGADGQARVFDFGVAKAAVRLTTTREGQLKGKLAYMAPEQIQRDAVDRRCDIYSASVVLWEALAGRRLFEAQNEGALINQILKGVTFGPSSAANGGTTIDPRSMVALEQLDAIVLRGLALDPAKRYPTARQMAMDLEAATKPASVEAVEEWVASTAGPTLAARAQILVRIESNQGEVPSTPSLPPEEKSGAIPVSVAETDMGSSLSASNRPSAIWSAPPKRLAWGRILKVAAVPLLLLLAYFGLYLPSRHNVPPTAIEAPEPSVASAREPQPNAPPPTAARATSSESPSEEPPATSPSSAAPAPPNTGKASVAAAVAKPAPPRTNAAPARACRTVSYFDGDGTKHFKQECP